MSDQTTSDDGSLEGELAQPQTISITSLDEENNSEDETEADKNTESSPSKDNRTESDNGLEENQTDNKSDDETEDGGSQLRPKTVTLKSTDEHKQRLVDMGAVSHHEDIKAVETTPLVKRCFSPKPKSERCYICGKEYLLSSLKVHEKQCAKKLAKENEKQSETQNGRKSVTQKSNFVSKIPRKLKLEACYLCGKELFSHSIGVHETQCIKNWKADKTPEANETSVAAPPSIKQSDEDIEVHHEKHVKNNHSESVPQKGEKSPKIEKKSEDGKPKVLKTIPCSTCGIQLLGHSLKIHEKKCRGTSKEVIDKSGDEKGSTESKETTNEVLESGRVVVESPRISKKPRIIVCYICGQEFLKSSYAVHEKQCAIKSKAKSEQESIKMTNEKSTAKVRKTYDTPADGSPHKPKTQKCFLCGKEMLLSSLKIHEQQCQRKLEILKNINQQGSPAQKPPQSTSPRKTGTKPKTEVCYVCSEAFLTSSIKVHEMQCEKKPNSNKKTKT